MKKMIAFALVAMLALPVAGFAQVLYVTGNNLGQTPGSVIEVGAGVTFNIQVNLDAGTESSAAEFVMTELLVVAPGVFKLGTVKINNTPLDLGDNAAGEYVMAFGGCEPATPLVLVDLNYGTFGGIVPPDTAITLRGLQPGDSVQSSFGGDMGYIDCSDNGYAAQMGGTDGGVTGSGVVFPDGSLMINGTPLVVDNESDSVGQLKARF